MKAKFNKRSAWVTFALVAAAVGGLLIYHYGYMVYQDYDYYTYYGDVHGLQPSNPVYVNGVRVGEVSDISITGMDRKVTVTMSINKKTILPKGTVAKLVSNGLLGSKMIFLEAGPGPGYYTHKSILKGIYDTTIMDMSDQIDPIVESVKYIIGTADKNLVNFTKKLDNGLVEKTQKDAVRMEHNMNRISTLVSKIQVGADTVINTLSKFRRASDTWVTKLPTLDKTIDDAAKSTADFAKKPVVETVTNLRNTVNKAREEATKLENTAIVDKALNNDEVIKTATEKLRDANNSMKEMKENPKGFSLIGK